MIEIELFYNQSSSAIRAEQADYLSKVKQIPVAQDLPEVETISAENYAKLTLWQKFVYRRRLRKQRKAYRKAKRRQKHPVDEVITKGYSAGIEMSLRVLKREFEAFNKRPDLDK